MINPPKRMCVIVLTNIAIAIGLFSKKKCRPAASNSNHSITFMNYPNRNPVSQYAIVNVTIVSLSLMSTTVSPVIYVLLEPTPDLNFLVSILGYMLAAVISSLTVCPVLYSQNLTTINQYFKRRFNSMSISVFGAIWILISQILLGAVVLYIPCNELSILVDQNFWLIVITAVIISVIFVCLGGIVGAVICEAIHGAVILICFIILICVMSQGITTPIWHDWLSLKMFTPGSLSMSLTYRGSSLWWSIIPGCLSSLPLYGVHQSSLQRLNQVSTSLQTIWCVILQVLLSSIIHVILQGLAHFTGGLLNPSFTDSVWKRAVTSTAMYCAILSSISPILTTCGSIVRCDLYRYFKLRIKRFSSNHQKHRDIVEYITVAIMGIIMILSTIVCQESALRVRKPYKEIVGLLGSIIDGPHAVVAVISLFLPCVRLKGAMISMVMVCITEIIIRFVSYSQTMKLRQQMGYSSAEQVITLNQSTVFDSVLNATTLTPTMSGNSKLLIRDVNKDFIIFSLLLLAITIASLASLIPDPGSSPTADRYTTINARSLYRAYSQRLQLSPDTAQRTDLPRSRLSTLPLRPSEQYELTTIDQMLD